MNSFLPDRARNLTDLAQIQILQKRFPAAEATLNEALDIYRKVVPANHVFVAEVYRDLGYVAEGLKQPQRALELSRQATAIYVARRTRDSNSRIQFQNNVELAWLASRTSPQAQRALLDEAFVAAQRAMISDTELSVTLMAARLASRDAGLQSLIRERQDLEASRGRLEKELVSTLASPELQPRTVDLRSQIEIGSTQIASLDQQLQTTYPQYQSLVQPTPLTPADVQAELLPDEALLTYFATYDQLFVWAITREAVVWKKVAVDPQDIETRVAELRRSLEVPNPDLAAKQGLLFNLARAHELYRLLIAPIEPAVAKKRQLIMVANGALTSLPFQVLVTEPTPPARGAGHAATAYAVASWLVRRHAISVLPSVGNLKSLRRVEAGAPGRRTLIGFGNPQFWRQPVPPVPIATAAQRSTTRSFAAYWRSRAPDADQLRTLAPLPNTEAELRGVAELLKARDAPLYFGAAADETAVKSARLADYRIVYFATHALVAGELSRLAEPALALAVPDTPSEANNGLLTASEAAQLRLDADWVVLSACNTAAGNRLGAEALSGLAQAFFYAGSRALLVSHWAVDDSATATLMVLTFDALAQSPTIGRAGALQSAMLALMADTKRPWSSYPSYWAPFFIVGLNTLPAARR